MPSDALAVGVWQRLQDRIRALHRDAQSPAVRHFVGAKPSSPHFAALENVP